VNGALHHPGKSLSAPKPGRHTTVFLIVRCAILGSSAITLGGSKAYLVGEMAELETDRLRIREMLASDVDGFLRYMQEERYWRDVPIEPPTAA
jgi:hypothetical protein